MGPVFSILRSKLRTSRFVLVVCLWIILLAFICWRLRGLAPDDMYITYRYAHNFLQGKGLTFNPGQRVFGVSDPGVAILLALGAAATGAAIPLVGTILTAVSLLAIATAVLWDAERRGGFAAAAAGGTLVVTSSFLWLGQGSGPLIALALLALAALLAERFPVAAGVMSGFAVWCRPDALAGVGILGWLMRRQTRRWPTAFAAAALLVCGIGLAAAWVYYGHPLPSTLVAKRQFASRNPASFIGLHGFWGRALDTYQWVEGVWGLALVPLGIVGTFFLYDRTRLAGRLILGYGIAVALGYTVLQIPFSIWYVGPPAAAMLMSSCFAVGGIARALSSRIGQAGAVVAVLAAVAAIGFPVAEARVGWLRRDVSADWRRTGYEAAGRWLAENTPPDADVAFDEIGIVGFYSERPMLDLVGLVSPSSIPFTGAGDQPGAFLANPTRYVLFHTHDRRGGTGPIVSQPWFRPAYRRLVRLRFPQSGFSMVVFERRPGAIVPPPRPPRDRRAIRRGLGSRPAAAQRR